MEKLIKQVSELTPEQRVRRLIEISMKQDTMTPIEIIELGVIQNVRKENGEIGTHIKNIK